LEYLATFPLAYRECDKVQDTPEQVIFLTRKGNDMTNYKDTGKVDVERKMIDGVEYVLCTRDGENELWLPAAGLVIVPPKCSNCGYSGVALDKHHVHGRKNSDETITLCANCHRELHMEKGYNL
jgi:hypothetical protein